MALHGSRNRLTVKNKLMALHIFETEDEVLAALADHFAQVANSAISTRGKFTVALSGGNSPKKLYELLAATYRTQIDWEKVHFFFGDERDVPKDNPDSNYLMAKNSLFDPLEISTTNIFPVDTSLPPKQAAEAYWTSIEEFFDDDE